MTRGATVTRASTDGRGGAGAGTPAQAVPRRPLARPLAWSFTGTVAAALAQWLVIVILARLGDPALVGQYALGLAVSAPVVLLAGLSLRTVAVTDDEGRFCFADYLRLRVAGMILALTVVGIAAATLIRDAGGVVALVGVAKALDSVGDVYFGLFQRHDRMDLIAVSLILNGVATVAAMSVLLVVTGSLAAATMGSVVASALASVVFCVLAARVVPPWTVPGRPRRFRTGPRMRTLLAIAAPLGLASALTSFSVNVPRYLVSHDLGAAQLGMFAALGYVVLAAALVFGSVSQVVLPRMSRRHAAGDVVGMVRMTARLCGVAAAAGAFAVAAAWAFGPAILQAVYGKPYADRASVLILLTVAAGISGLVFFLNAALCAARRFVNQLAVNAISAVVCVAASVVLVPRGGLTGAAWAVILTLACDCLIKIALVHRVAAAARRGFTRTATERVAT